MTSNFNINYINDVPPAQEYEEFGDETNETVPVPFEYAPIIHNVQHTGVSSFEFNGTTYYNYYAYEVPVLSYTGYDYSIEEDADANVVTEEGNTDTNVVTEEGNTNTNVVIEEGNTETNVVTEEGNTNINVVTEEGNTVIYYLNVNTEDVYDYSVGVNADNVIDSNVVTEHGSDNNHYQQSSFYCDSVSSDLSTVSSVYISYDSAYSDSFSTGISYNKSYNNARTVYNDNYPVETHVTSTEKLNSYVSFSNPIESHAINDRNNACPNTQIKEQFDAVRNKDNNLEIVAKYDINASDINAKTDSANCNESNVLEHLSDVRKKNLYEDFEEQSFVYEENTVLDWTTEVEDNDVKEVDDDSFKMNFPTSNDMDPYNSKEVIKYLKDNLYLYALSGHMSLKESLPVVDILPIIDEETESVEEDYRFEGTVDDLEHKEEKILSDDEKNEVADLSSDSQPFIESHALEYTVENSEQVAENISDLVEKNLSSVPTVYTSEQHLSNREDQAAQRDEMVKNDDNIHMKNTKLVSFNGDCTSLGSGEELQISVENVLNPVERDNVLNATLKLPPMHNQEKKNLSKHQNDCIKIVEEIGATEIKSLCPKNDIEVEIKKELILDQDDSNHVTNTTSYVPRKRSLIVNVIQKKIYKKQFKVTKKFQVNQKRENSILSENGSATCVVVQEKKVRSLCQNVTAASFSIAM